MTLFLIFPQVGKTMSLIHKLCSPATGICEVVQTQSKILRRDLSCRWLLLCWDIDKAHFTLVIVHYRAPCWKTSAICTVRCWLCMSNCPMRDSSDLQECEEESEEMLWDAQTWVFDSQTGSGLQEISTISCSSKYMYRVWLKSVVMFRDTHIWCVIPDRFWPHFAYSWS